MPRMTGGQALVQQLKLEGVDTVFGLPGVQLDFAFDALYEERDSVRVVYPRHEQSTAYMADGYARVTGRVGTSLVVPGPGLLNTMAALSTAYACSSPVLCITGQIDSRWIGVGRGELHEVKDQMGAAASVTKWQGRAMTPAEVPGLVHAAFEQLHTGRPRPVEIEIPPDVLQLEGDVRLLEAEHFERPGGDPDAIEAAARALAAAKNPVIFAGGGIISSGAWEELQRLAEMLEAPVVMTMNGRGAISDRHHLAFSDAANRALGTQADVVFAVGTRFLVGGSPPWRRGEQSVIQMDIDPEEIGRNYKPDVAIEADARKGLTALAEHVGRYNSARPSRREEFLALKQTIIERGRQQQPQYDLGMALRESMSDDTILISESTQVGYWARSFMPVYQPRTFFTPGYSANLGYGFATAIGAQIGAPDRRVVSISGDGGFMYTASDISTLVQNKVPLVAIVFNDNAFGNVKRMQEEKYGGHMIAVELHNPDLMKLADAYGLRGRRAKDASELRTELRTALSLNEPTLIEVPVPSMEWYAGRTPPRPPQA
ncbi:MAG TPA: thiamine pyrophosphate-dependent enzyme [Dehalococcoidia bacterium]|nr:thiamine pyrophosphate-dependent enzyme [Dehalococcoidia bacterium]